MGTGDPANTLRAVPPERVRAAVPVFRAVIGRPRAAVVPVITPRLGHRAVYQVDRAVWVPVARRGMQPISDLIWSAVRPPRSGRAAPGDLG